MGYIILQSGLESAAGVVPASIPSAETFGSPSVVSRTQYVLSPALYEKLYPEKQIIRTTGIASAEAFGTPDIGIEVGARSISSAERFGRHAVLMPLPQVVRSRAIGTAARIGRPVVIKHINRRREEEEALALLLAA